MSKKCGECANFDRSLSKCNKIQDDSIRENDTVICCPFYELKPPSVFDLITESPEVLAEGMVYQIYDVDGYEWWTSTLCNYTQWELRAEAIAATVARLKEVDK